MATEPLDLAVAGLVLGFIDVAGKVIEVRSVSASAVGDFRMTERGSAPA